MSLLEQLTRQRKVVADLREPERILADLEAAYAVEQEEREQKTARKAQAEAELFDCERSIARRAPREAKIAAAIDVLDTLADDAMGGWSQHINPYTCGMAAAQCRTELEMLANERAAQKRLTAEIRALKRDLGVK